MAITAKARARTALVAKTTLEPQQALDVVKAAAGEVQGGGLSLLTSGLQNLGSAVHIENESPGMLDLSINSGKRLVELCTFSATAHSQDCRTELKVGGLETYKTNQPKLLYVIPLSPKSIAGVSPYKRFLEGVREALMAADPSAAASITDPGAG